MPSFYYQARNDDDQPVTGELDAKDLQEAIAQIESRGWSLETIGTVVPQSASLPVGNTARRITASPDDVMRHVFRSHLESVLQRTRSIVPALKAFSEEAAAKTHRGELQRLIQIIESGDAAEAEQAFADLPDYWVPLISAAMGSNDPGRILQEFLNESQRSDELRRQWRLTLAYPILVACLAAVVLTFLSVLVIPIFRAIFLDFGLSLPTITAANLEVAYWIAYMWKYIAVAAFIVFVIAIVLCLRSRSRGAPSTFFGRLLYGRTAAVARLSQFTADLLEAGLSVPDALQVAGLLTRKKRYRYAIWRLADEQQSKPSEVPRFAAPPRLATIFYALRADLPTASRVHLLREITETNLETTRRSLSWTRGFLEPVSIVVIGLLVGTVVISLFLPLIKLINGLSG
jgi:type IV pilus assembly protein PilC